MSISDNITFIVFRMLFKKKTCRYFTYILPISCEHIQILEIYFKLHLVDFIHMLAQEGSQLHHLHCPVMFRHHYRQVGTSPLHKAYSESLLRYLHIIPHVHIHRRLLVRLHRYTIFCQRRPNLSFSGKFFGLRLARKISSQKQKKR